MFTSCEGSSVTNSSPLAGVAQGEGPEGSFRVGDTVWRLGLGTPGVPCSAEDS